MRNLFWFKPQEVNGHRSSAQALSTTGPSGSKHPKRKTFGSSNVQTEAKAESRDLVLLFIKVQGEVLNMEQKSITGIASRIKVSSVAGAYKI